ncbi:MAG: hypothetical protein IV100_06365 [Myxococcales bacterium]|nr:hypothetical protein [Myxococcales bacterium]
MRHHDTTVTAIGFGRLISGALTTLRTGATSAALLAAIGCASGGQPDGEAIDRQGESELGLELQCTSALAPATAESGGCESVDAFKARATALCDGQGQSLGSIGYAGKCDGGWQKAQYSCCGQVEVAPPPSLDCAVQIVGSGDCRSDAELKTLAKVTCGGPENVTDIAWGGACTGGHQYAKVTCCTAPGSEEGQGPAPEDNAPCAVRNVNVEGACADPAALEDLADAACDGLGRSASGFTLGASCGAGTYDAATVTCCDAPSSEEPNTGSDVANTCAAGLLGGADACKSTFDWHQAAAARCAAQDLVLSKFDAYDTCGPNRTSFASFTCCPTFPDGELCKSIEIGGEDYCAPDSIWQAAAKGSCNAIGRDLQSVGVNTPCGDGYWRAASVACCGTEASPPPAVEPKKPAYKDTCLETKLTSAFCTDDDEWQEKAQSFCTARRAYADRVIISSSCATGGSISATVTCCGGAPAPKCERRSLDWKDLCVSDLDAQAVAKTVCRKAHRARVVGLAAGACSQGGRKVDFECCD